MKIKGILLLTLLITSLALVALPAPQPVSANKDYDKCDRRVSFGRCKPHVVAPDIEFIKWERSAGGVRFYYKVTAGSRDVTQWTLSSFVFRNAKLLCTSEKPYVYNQKHCTITFNKPIKAGHSRIFWFDLKMDYQGITLGHCLYTIKANTHYMGWVRGPV